MPRRKAEPGNPEWIAILQAEKDRIVERDPESKVQYTYVRAINELRNTHERIDFPGQRTVKYVGAKMIELIKRKLASGFTLEDAEDSFAEDDFNHLRAPALATHNRFLQGNATIAIPKGLNNHNAYKNKGKQRARRSPSLYSDEENDHAATSSKYRPAQGSGPHAILVGMYTQCEPNNQRIWLGQHEVLSCAAPFSTQDAHRMVGSGGQHLFASVWAGMTILTMKGLVYEDTSQPHIPRYALSYAGYTVAETCAGQAGFPKLVVTNWTIKEPWHQVSAPAHASVSMMISASDARAQAKSAWTKRYPSVHSEGSRKPAMNMEEFLAEQSDAAFALSRKRKISETDAELEKGLVFSWRDVPEPSMPVIPQQQQQGQSAAAPAAVQTLRGKPLARKFANGSFAGVYKAAPTSTAAPAADTMPFLFSYLDANDNRVKTKDEADVQQHEATMSTMYKVEFRSKQARHPLARIILNKKPLIRSIPFDHQEECGPTEYGYILAEKALPTCPGLPSSSTKEKEKGKEKKISAVDSLMAGGKKTTSKDPRAMYKMSGVQLLGSTSSASASSSSSPDLRTLHAKEGNPVAVVPPPVQRSISDPSCSSSTPKPRVVNALPAFKQTLPTPSTSSPNTFTAANVSKVSSSTVSAPSQPSSSSPLKRPSLARSTSSTFSLGCDLDTPFPAFDPIKIPAGSFYIHLYVDHRERKGQAGLESALVANNIPYLTKALDLGDYVWTAKRKVPHYDLYDEVVIAVCERKRFDDFIQCIKSEIYKNQKRRIKAAGIRKCFYLAEQANIARSTDYATFMKAIATSLSETQVVDGFNLHVAMNEQDATNYLVRLTKAFQIIMTTQDLHIIPDGRVDGSTIALLQDQLAEQQPEICHFTTLAAFERLGKVPHTLKSCWSKMLCSVSGTSEEQCFDILEHFPTPASLLEEMSERLESVNEQGEIPAYGRKTKKLKESAPELFLKKRLERGQPRPMTVPLSTRYWELFTSTDYSAASNTEG